MKVSEEIESVTQITDVKKVKYLGDYVLRILFSDGHEQAVDFKPFLKNSTHPGIRKYLSEKKFKEYKIIHGNINWNDYELIFPIDDLYNGKII